MGSLEKIVHIVCISVGATTYSIFNHCIDEYVITATMLKTYPGDYTIVL